MLSRRNIRVKVMQVQYAKRLDKELMSNTMEIRYRKSIDKTYNLYLFSVLQLVKTASMALRDEEKRQSKYLPTDEDRSFSSRLYNNPIVDTIVKDSGFDKMVKDGLIENLVDVDMTRLFYSEFAKTDEYKTYAFADTVTIENHRDILLALHKFCLGNENYVDYIEERFENWVHDKSLVIGSMKKTIKGLVTKSEFHEDYIPGDEATLEFGEDLLYKTMHFDNELHEIIQPALKNWDIDRVAVIDLVLLKMAVCEMLHFPTIPVKVTINEYVDISKIYSTPKSKDFINGILDRLMKKMTESGQIKKEGRGLID